MAVFEQICKLLPRLQEKYPSNRLYMHRINGNYPYSFFIYSLVFKKSFITAAVNSIVFESDDGLSAAPMYEPCADGIIINLELGIKFDMVTT